MAESTPPLTPSRPNLAGSPASANPPVSAGSPAPAGPSAPADSNSAMRRPSAEAESHLRRPSAANSRPAQARRAKVITCDKPTPRILIQSFFSFFVQQRSCHPCRFFSARKDATDWVRLPGVTSSETVSSRWSSQRRRTLGEPLEP